MPEKEEQKPEEKPPQSKEEKPAPKDNLVVTQHKVRMEYYEAGHMMYIHMPSLKKMKVDLARFIKSASS